MNTADKAREVIVKAATGLLASSGPDAVTTRSVAIAAGVQAPAIYRLFGDKNGLLSAVVEAGIGEYLAAAPAGHACADPVDDLRAGWDLAVEFGLGNPALYTLAYGGPGDLTSAAFSASMEMLMRRVRRLAAGGLLAVDEGLAVLIIHATARGAVLTALSIPAGLRDPALLTTMREAMIAAVTNRRPAVPQSGPAGAARALRASLAGQTTLTAAEVRLLRQWLDRLTARTGAEGSD
ncbi:TetR/AcrR family transcriptional regulator [Amycolatopsis jejuensis]|uniref:TetR/AcrR family transcriptional regulator n=1 Tax=Amycolatopsis jejuensis TaxID=330084 RepID=UPI0005274B27|nr:TetR/AcrR family transcriptional regulator [Amycolatopsis jejuensis]